MAVFLQYTVYVCVCWWKNDNNFKGYIFGKGDFLDENFSWNKYGTQMVKINLSQLISSSCFFGAKQTGGKINLTSKLLYMIMIVCVCGCMCLYVCACVCVRRNMKANTWTVINIPSYFVSFHRSCLEENGLPSMK